jgi:hypothetical protein
MPASYMKQAALTVDDRPSLQSQICIDISWGISLAALQAARSSCRIVSLPFRVLDPVIAVLVRDRVISRSHGTIASELGFNCAHELSKYSEKKVSASTCQVAESLSSLRLARASV